MMNDQESFYTAIGPIIKVAQYFGILPISGVMKQSPSIMEFKIKSFRTYWTVSIIVALVIIFLSVIVTIIETLTIGNSNIREVVSALVFFGHALMSLILFLRLSPKWIKLLQKWEKMENKLTSFDVEGPEIRSKIKKISIIFALFALFEHCLYVINYSINNGFPGYFSRLYEFVISAYNIDAEKFSFTNFNSTFIMSIIFLIIEHFASFIWSFTDLFIILITTGLTERYVWLNKRVKYLSRRKYQAIPWNQLRKNYAILNDLVKQTNNDLSALIFLSYTTNFYFICVRLFNEIGINTTGQFDNIYIFVSYCYVIGRTIAVTLSASRINIASKEALPHIYLCQSSKFTDEANRLQNQLTYDNIGFTGMNFFSITRNFMLVTAGTIVTYELILVQFHDQANK